MLSSLVSSVSEGFSAPPRTLCISLGDSGSSGLCYLSIFL